MVGLSHYPFRELLREYLPKGALTLWPSEMLNSRRIPNENLPNIPEAQTGVGDNFWMPQILANDEEKIEKSSVKTQMLSHREIRYFLVSEIGFVGYKKCDKC